MYMYMKPSALPRVLSPRRSGGGMNFEDTGPSPAIVLPWQVQQIVWNRLSPRASDASDVGGARSSLAATSYGAVSFTYASRPIVGTLSESGAPHVVRCGSIAIVWRMSRVG